MPRTVVTVVYNRFGELARRLPKAAQEICVKTALAAETVVKTGMAAEKAGHWYGDHRASAPGEMPAVDMGVLAGSIQTEWEGNGVVVYTNQEYAPILEYGAPAAGIAPRPFFGPAAEQVRPEFVRAMRDLERRL